MSTLTPCRGCGQPIRWEKTTAGKWTCFNPDGETHWATCPEAKRFKKKAQAPIEDASAPNTTECSETDTLASTVERSAAAFESAFFVSLDTCARCRRPLSLLWVEVSGINGHVAICLDCWIEDNPVSEAAPSEKQGTRTKDSGDPDSPGLFEGFKR